MGESNSSLIDQHHRETCDECGARAIYTSIRVLHHLVSDAPPQIETHIEFWRKQCMRVERHTWSGQRGVNQS